MALLTLARHFSESTDGGDTDGAGGGASTATTDASATDNGATKDVKADEQNLGEAGKKALKAERDARKEAERRATAAEKERDDLRAATQSDTEKAISTARKEAAAEERSKWEGLIRRTRVEQALTAAGCIDPALASLAPDFADLTVTDTGSVDGIDSVIESFKEAHPRQFAATAPGGSADQGVRPNNDNRKPATLEQAITAEIAKQRAGRSA